jgi:hypothetical protein
MARDFTLMGNALYDTANFEGAIDQQLDKKEGMAMDYSNSSLALDSIGKHYEALG